MKNVLCAIAAIACASAFSQAPEAAPGPAKGSADRVQLVGANQMPLPPLALQFMNDLEMVKSHQVGAALSLATVLP
jgi:hypothetical protein